MNVKQDFATTYIERKLFEKMRYSTGVSHFVSWSRVQNQTNCTELAVTWF